MQIKWIPTFLIFTVSLSILGGIALAQQDRYTLKIPGGLAFSEFRGYEAWQDVAPSVTEGSIKSILANPTMMNAYKAGIPGNGKDFPDGSRIVKIEWTKKKSAVSPYPVEVPDNLKSLSFIVKDTKRFPDTHGWGYATFEYDAVSSTFTPATEASKPPQGHDAKCGAACHNLAASKDYIFTPYAKR